MSALLVCFLSLNENFCETRKNVFYFTSEALLNLEKIKVWNFKYSNFKMLSNALALQSLTQRVMIHDSRWGFEFSWLNSLLSWAVSWQDKKIKINGIINGSVRFK